MTWKDEYRELMFPVNRSEVKLEEARKIKFENIPTSLFKYRPVSDFSFDNLINDTVRVTKASEFNDPYDCALQVSHEKVIDERLKIAFLKEIPQIFKKHNVNYEQEEIDNVRYQSYKDLLTFAYSKASKQEPEKVEGFVTQVYENSMGIHEEFTRSVISDFQEGTCISCFSEEVNSILMWSHYAYNHKGFCIEYNFTQCDKSDALTRDLYPANYTNELFDIADFLIQKNNVNKLFTTYSAITKSDEWNYEKEWRLVLTYGKGKAESFNLEVVKPTAIYLGAKISEENRKTVINIAKSKGLRVFQMKMSSNAFKLFYDEVSI
ncbi:hypothetical protein OKW24_005259 [Peribacillus simplex]|uniref:DUF2971 domain-containing protein n=1 Tax=Peribacillus simplex TaxID=1478 RepID=UPI0024E23ACA|nr:DUF2971 domain-containing protein [Peribacillus simplex]MDF9763486.1 hypothetical protein [Peribacillus simplex]